MTPCWLGLEEKQSTKEDRREGGEEKRREEKRREEKTMLLVVLNKDIDADGSSFRRLGTTFHRPGKALMSRYKLPYPFL